MVGYSVNGVASTDLTYSSCCCAEVGVGLASPAVTLNENDTATALLLIKTGEASIPVEVIISFISGSASGEATPTTHSLTTLSTVGGDYIATEQTVTFAAAEQVKAVPVVLVDDDVVEEVETFTALLSAPANTSGVVIALNTTVITLLDSDSESACIGVCVCVCVFL